MEAFGLIEQHQGIIRSYIKFSKHQRARNLKFIDISFQDIIDSRLLEDTYTKDEVEELLQNLKNVVSGEVAAELMEISHINVLLFTQLFTQAEKWHLRMNVDLSDVQNRELLEKVKIMEENENKTQPNPHRLQPLSDNTGSFELLKIEIERLKEENLRLEKQTLEYESKLNKLTEEKVKLNSLFECKEEEINELKLKAENLSLSIQNEQMESNLSKNDSDKLLGEYEQVLTEQLRLEMESMRQEHLSIQSQLSLTEQELERKFNQTAAYNNMKMMIAKKNEQVKDLRKQLLKYEKTDVQTCE